MHTCRLELNLARWTELWSRVLENRSANVQVADTCRTFGYSREELFEALLRIDPEIRNGQNGDSEISEKTVIQDFFGAYTGTVPGDPEQDDPTPPYEALSLIARVNHVKWVEPGSGLSYGHTFTAERKMRIATLTIGYGDGYCRYFSNKGSFIVRGVACPVVGRVCMDQTLIDVTDHPERSMIGVETEAIAAGHELLPWSDVLRTGGLLPVEMLSGIGRRVARTIV